MTAIKEFSATELMSQLLSLASQCRQTGRLLDCLPDASGDGTAWFEAGLQVLDRCSRRFPVVGDAGKRALRVSSWSGRANDRARCFKISVCSLPHPRLNPAHAYLSSPDPVLQASASEVLNQLIEMITPHADPDDATYAPTPQELRQIKILQIRCMPAGDQERMEVLVEELIGSMDWTEEGVHE